MRTFERFAILTIYPTAFLLLLLPLLTSSDSKALHIVLLKLKNVPFWGCKGNLHRSGGIVARCLALNRCLHNIRLLQI